LGNTIKQWYDYALSSAEKVCTPALIVHMLCHCVASGRLAEEGRAVTAREELARHLTAAVPATGGGVDAAAREHGRRSQRRALVAHHCARVSLTLCARVCVCDCALCSTQIYTFNDFVKFTPPVNVRGGILAEEMGLGKTIEVRGGSLPPPPC
jgi:SNF2 family DNA or RNA helicase